MPPLHRLVDDVARDIESVIDRHAQFIQRTPELANATRVDPNAFAFSDVSGILIAFGLFLGSTLAGLMTVAPAMTESTSGLVRAYTLVGVKLDVYLFANLAAMLLTAGLGATVGNGQPERCQPRFEV